MILSSSFDSAMTFICNFRIAVPDPFFANFPNCRPGPFFFFTNFGNCPSRSLFMQIVQIIVLDRFLLQILEILVQDTFLQIFQIVVPDLLLQNFEIVVPDLKFCKLSKNSLGPKTKNGLIFEFFFAKEVAVLKRVCDRKEEQVEMIAHFSFC